MNHKNIEMKTIGFIKQYDEHKEAKELQEYLIDNYENVNKDVIISYLEKGVPAIDWMTWLFDEDGVEEISIGPHGCTTDGIWVWPSYLEYYLKKYSNFKLDQEFVDYVIQNKNKQIEVSKEENIKIQDAYNILTNSNTDRGTNLLEEND